MGLFYEFYDALIMTMESPFQVFTQREKDTKDQNMPLLMKTRMETGCWLEMFLGSKFLFLPLFSQEIYPRYACNLQGFLILSQNVHKFMQEIENHERIRS